MYRKDDALWLGRLRACFCFVFCVFVLDLCPYCSLHMIVIEFSYLYSSFPVRACVILCVRVSNLFVHLFK